MAFIPPPDTLDQYGNILYHADYDTNPKSPSYGRMVFSYWQTFYTRAEVIQHYTSIGVLSAENPLPSNAETFTYTNRFGIVVTHQIYHKIKTYEDSAKTKKRFDHNQNIIFYSYLGFNNNRKYNNENSLLYYDNSHGYKEWYTYDSRENLIHYRNTDGFEYTQTFDGQDRLLSYQDNKDWAYSQAYDPNGNKYYYNDSNGIVL